MRLRVALRAWLGVLALAMPVLLASCAAPQKMVRGPWPKEVLADSGWAGADDPETMDPTIPPYDPLTAAGPGDQIKARFRGNDRKVAKIKPASAGLEPETTIDDLAGAMVDDDDMLSHDPPITKDKDSDRVEEERRSVRVKGWIYAIKYEDDQDWHLIVGTDPDAGQATYFNCEVSGLPAKTASAYGKMLKVRESLATILDNDLPGPGAYTKYPTPIPVRIQGSLFFDIDHAAGVVGPSGMRPETAWEIHPITRIEFAP